MKKKIITLPILLIALFSTSCGVRSGRTEQQASINPATFDEGVVINRVRWATRNVDMPGTFAANPEDFGMLFQWNRKKAWNTIDEEVEGWDNTPAMGTQWYAENDPCPPGWRVPTGQELQTLGRVSNERANINGIDGRLFGSAPNQIFLPFAGMRWTGGELDSSGAVGYYWGSTLFEQIIAEHLWFGNSHVTTEGIALMRRFFGLSIRCVSIEPVVVDPTFDEGVVINGVRWATRNVDMPGTFATNPEDAGMFFQWNSKEAWSGVLRNTEFDVFDIEFDVFDVFDIEFDVFDIVDWEDEIEPCVVCLEWEKENDPCPPGWRIPTKEELQQLAQAPHTWTTINGVDGMLFGRALYPYQVFLPAAGNVKQDGGRIFDAGLDGRYWSNMQRDNENAHSLRLRYYGERFFPSSCASVTWRRLNLGLNIRCVAKN